MTLFTRELLAIPALQMWRETGVAIINAPWKSLLSFQPPFLCKQFQTSERQFPNRIVYLDLSNFISDLKWGYVTFCITDEVKAVPTKYLICFEILGLSFEICLLKCLPRADKNLSGNSSSYFCLWKCVRKGHFVCTVVLIVWFNCVK